MEGHVQENRLKTRGQVLHDVVQVKQTSYVLLLTQSAVNLLDANLAAFYLTNFEILKVPNISQAEISYIEVLAAGLFIHGLNDVEIRRRRN